jgi:hypothetical protein
VLLALAKGGAVAVADADADAEATGVGSTATGSTGGGAAMGAVVSVATGAVVAISGAANTGGAGCLRMARNTAAPPIASVTAPTLIAIARATPLRGGGVVLPQEPPVRPGDVVVRGTGASDPDPLSAFGGAGKA